MVDGAESGHRTAAEQRRLPQRQLGGDRDRACGRHDCVLGEAGDVKPCCSGSPSASVSRGRRRPVPRQRARRRARTACGDRNGRRHSSRTGRPARARRDRRATRVTPSPTASTTPAPSWPSTIGQRPSPSSPSARCRSEWQTPAAAIRTRTSPGPGGSSDDGLGRATAPGSRSTQARRSGSGARSLRVGHRWISPGGVVARTAAVSGSESGSELRPDRVHHRDRGSARIAVAGMAHRDLRGISVSSGSSHVNDGSTAPEAPSRSRNAWP